MTPTSSGSRRPFWINVSLTLALVILAIAILSGCATIGARMMTPADVAETAQLLEATKASGCTWFRGKGNPPAAQLEIDIVYAFGGNNYLACVQTLRGGTPSQ